VARDEDGRSARLEATQSLLAEGLRRLVSGGDWQAYLALQARLHGYSPANVLLISAQHAAAFESGAVPSADPGRVAGFATWRSLGRSVLRGQHGYAILVPHYRRRPDPPVGERGAPGTGAESLEGGDGGDGCRLAGFGVAHVFSEFQTAGVPLPAGPRPVLSEGAAPAGLAEATSALIEASGLSVELAGSAAELGGANGVTDWSVGLVRVRADMDEAARCKTLLHEAGHVLLHGDATGRRLPREVKEVEAESVAFVVAAAHGMDTGGYSFPYVAGWAGADPLSAVRATQRRVAVAARVVLAASPAATTDGGRPPAPLTAAGPGTGPVAPAPAVGVEL